VTTADAIAEANQILPGTPAPEDAATDPRWQAIIAVGEFIESDPEAVWEFVARWGRSDDSDLRAAIATCLLEHLLEHHFGLLFDRVNDLAIRDARFADTFARCWKFGQAELPGNADRFDVLRARCVALAESSKSTGPP
jgi:hypothetical protein